MNQKAKLGFCGIACLVFTFGTSACSSLPQEGPVGQERAADRAAIESVIAAHYKTPTSADQRADDFTGDAVLAIHDGPKARGRTAIRKQLKPLEDVSIKPKITRIRFIGPNDAVVDIDYELPEHTDQGTHILTREDGQWRFAYFRVYNMQKE